MKHNQNKKMFFLILTLFLIGIHLAIAEDGISECSSWDDVIATYYTYVNGQANWSDVITCYSEYAMPPEYAFVTTTDYETGHFATIKLVDQSVTQYQLELSSDAIPKTIGGKIYVINRLGQDNITIFSPPDFSHPLIQFSTGNGTNPHDIVLASTDKAYVSLYEKGYLLVANPITGAELKKIDISSFADNDNIPEADQMVIVDGILYVALQKLDRYNQYQPAENGEILMIDTGSDTIVGSITLSGQNPYDIFYNKLMGKLVISETGSFYDLTDGGIETVDLDTHEVSGYILTESELGGNITEFVMKPSSNQGYIIVTDGSYNTSIVSFDLEKAVKLKDILAPKAGFIHSGIALGSGKLLVGDRSFTNPGVRIFSTQTDEQITTKPINTGLPPFSITIY